jgi:hypothetical protein
VRAGLVRAVTATVAARAVRGDSPADGKDPAAGTSQAAMSRPLAPLAALLLLAAAAAQEHTLRVVPAPPPAPPPAAFAWSTDHGAAVRRARERQQLVLLYFTAAWCGPCKAMVRETFPDPEVQQALGELAAIELDIDLPASADLFARYGEGAVPGFALVDGQGDLVHRWSGAGQPAGFLAEIATGRDRFADPDVRRRHAAEQDLLAAVLRADEAALAAASRSLDPASGLAETLHHLGAGCRTRRRWADLAAVATRLLASEGAAADLRADAELWLDEGEFHTLGVVPERLVRRIDAWIEVMAEPFPGSSLSARVRRLLGGGDSASTEAATAWVRRANDTRDALVRLGQPAFAPLLAAMRRRADVAEDCAHVLGRMKLPGTAEAVRRALESGELRAAVRAAHVGCLAELKDAQCLPWLLEYAATNQPVPVRTIAIDGLKHLALQTGREQDPAIAVAVAAALRARDRGLCAEALQAAFQVQHPLPLDALDELLDDRRPIFSDYVLADNALWILAAQLGVQLVDAEGQVQVERATPAAVATLRAFLRQHEGRLRWSAESRQYRVVD